MKWLMAMALAALLWLAAGSGALPASAAPDAPPASTAPSLPPELLQLPPGVGASPAATRPAAGHADDAAEKAAHPSAPASRPASPSTRAASLAGKLPDRALTMQEIRQLCAEHADADAIKAISRALQLRGKPAEAYDRHELLMLKADALLRTRASAAAASTFLQAAQATDDPRKVALAKATAALLKRSRGLSYAPAAKKGQRPAPIDVVDPQSRKRALQALLADEMAAVTPRVEAALEARSLAPIADALDALQGLDVLERATEGDDADSKQLVGDLRDRGRALMAKALQRLAKRVDEIDKKANELVEYRVRVADGAGFREESRLRKRGLTMQDRNDLKGVIDTCVRIAPNAVGLAKVTGGKKTDVEEIVDVSEDLGRRARRVLEAGYQ